MNRRWFLSLPAAAAFALRAQSSEKPRLRRKDSFFGLHFDLHPDRSDTALGRDVTDEMVGALLDKVRPDYVQYDSKGHVGYLGWPSKVGPAAPGIVRDSLEVWRRETARRGVALYIHFSGLYDIKAVEDHPEWARVSADGKPDKEKTSTFGPYVDERMIPQLREAATKYSLDGAWVDGECWAAAIDYSDAAAKAWGKPLPKKPGDPGWLEFLDFNREQFRRFVTHYIEEVHRTNPQFQIASNWLYSTYVPEKPSIPVDFLSGDFLGNAAISSARLEARYLGATGLPWDLMAWGFFWGQSNHVGNVWKPAVQLQQEAAVVLAQGGGFQSYYNPTRAGRIDVKLVDTMADVAAFCRSRQKLAHQSWSVPQAGLLFSRNSLYRSSSRLFGGWGGAENPARGMLDALVELHYSVDVIPDWKLDEVAAGYPFIVVPDWADIGEAVHRSLVRYVERGGRLLVTGAANARLFASVLGLILRGDAKDAEAFVVGKKLAGNASGLWQAVAADGPGELLAHRYATSDLTRDVSPAAHKGSLGKGTIAGIPGPIGSVYGLTHDPAVREFLGGVIERVWKPDLEVNAPPTVEVALRRKDGRTVVHLVNATGMQVAGEYSVIDFVPPVGPVEVALRLPQRPKAAAVLPEGSSLALAWEDGWARVTVPKLEIHSMVVFD